MIALRNIFYNIPKVSSLFVSVHKSVSLSCYNRLHLGHVARENHRSDSDNKEDEIPQTMSSRYETFSEETAPVILDVQEERRKIDEQSEDERKKYDKLEGINVSRGKTGVFDIEELVDLLRKEKALDLFVVKVPPEYMYVDYMVIVTGRSSRHMLAMAEFARKVYKLKDNNNNSVPKIEGQKSKNWMAIDLGNIVLHVFSKEDRVTYDLETLWSVGKEYDTLSLKKSTVTDNILSDYNKLLESLTPDTEKMESSS